MERDVKNVILYWMEGEITSFIKVWISAYLCLCYCYVAGKMLPSGAARLSAVLPVVGLFLLLPLQLHSMHLGGTTAFFLAWLTNFKLLLLAFDKGPLFTPSISLPRFLAVACLPIKLQRQEEHQSSKSKDNKKKISLNYAVKALCLALLLKVYDYGEYIHPWLIVVLYSFHIYLGLEIILAIAAAMGRGLLGAELEPQFNEPYLSSSLQDFWSRRWNLMVTRILRPTVYLPVLEWSSTMVGRKWAPLPAVMGTFLVSGLMHELMFYYLGRVRPTWEITWFFLLHGASLMAEIFVKKAVNGRWRVPRVVGTTLIVGFVLVTSSWLFFPQLLRCGGYERGMAEIAAVAAFLKDLSPAIYFSVNS